MKEVCIFKLERHRSFRDYTRKSCKEFLLIIAFDMRHYCLSHAKYLLKWNREFIIIPATLCPDLL